MKSITLWRRLKASMRDPEMRANALALAGGKAIGLTLVLTAMSMYLPTALHAQAAPAGPSASSNKRRSSRQAWHALDDSPASKSRAGIR